MRLILVSLILVGCGRPDPDEVAAQLYDRDHLVQVEAELDVDDAAVLSTERTTLFELLYGADCLSQPLGADYTWFEADLRVDGVRMDRSGIRKKGLLGSLSESKPSLKVKFDKFVDGQQLGDIERMTLNNGISDPTLMNQCLGYDLFAKAGIASPRCNFAEVYGNGERMGPYVHLESLKRRFLDRTYGNADGDLYEGTVSDFRDGWLGSFEADTDETDPDKAVLHAVTTALDAPEDQLLDELSAVLDLEEFFTFWALEVVVGHIDGHSGNTNNFYVYRDPTDDLLHFIPWGIDAIFRDGVGLWGQDTDAVVLANGALTLALWNHPEGRVRYKAELRRVLDEVWDEDELLGSIDQMEGLIGPDASEIDVLRSFVKTRRSALLSALDGPDPEWTDLRNSPCYVPVGDLTLTFDTTWGTLGDDPWTAGTGTAVGDVTDIFLDLQGGAVAGIDDEDRAVVAVAATYGDEILVVQLTLPKDQVGTGTVEIEGHLVEGRLYSGPTGEDYAALLAPGTVTFDTASRQDGAPVRGTIQVEVLGGGL